VLKGNVVNIETAREGTKCWHNECASICDKATPPYRPSTRSGYRGTGVQVPGYISRFSGTWFMREYEAIVTKDRMARTF
jgi:hypothetical protein